jgi:hypothetical protein
MRLSVSGLPDKVLSGETFQINMAIDSTSGSYFSLGERSFSLDGILRLLQNRIEKIDFRPLEELMLHGVQSISYATVLSYTRSIIEAKLASELIGRVGNFVIENTEIWIMNQLEVEAISSGPVTVSNNVLRTWFGRSATMALQVGQVVQRGLSLDLSFVSKWVMQFHFDFKQSLYSHQLIGGIMRKIKDALHLPWEPVLGTSKGSSTPSISSRILLPDFTVQTVSGVQSVFQGEQARFRISLTSLDEFDSPVRLTVQGLPTGANGFFGPNEVTPSGDTVLTVETGTGTNLGSHTLTVTGEGGGKTHQVSMQLVVNARPQVRTTDMRTTRDTWTPSQTLVPYWQQAPLMGITVIAGVALLIGLVYVISRRTTTGIQRVSPTSQRRVLNQHELRFCRFCGEPSELGSNFCLRCGKKLRAR